MPFESMYDPASADEPAQVGGFSPTPQFLKSDKQTMYQTFGDGAYFIGSPISSEQMVWATTNFQPTKVREDWRRFSPDDGREMIKGLQAAEWAHGPKQLVETATFATKYGQYLTCGTREGSGSSVMRHTQRPHI